MPIDSHGRNRLTSGCAQQVYAPPRCGIRRPPHRLPAASPAGNKAVRLPLHVHCILGRAVGCACFPAAHRTPIRPQYVIFALYGMYHILEIHSLLLPGMCWIGCRNAMSRRHAPPLGHRRCHSRPQLQLSDVGSGVVPLGHSTSARPASCLLQCPCGSSQLRQRRDVCAAPCMVCRAASAGDMECGGSCSRMRKASSIVDVVAGTGFQASKASLQPLRR